jgi:hypothetical protein
MPYIGTMKWDLSHLEVLPRVIGLLCQLAFPLTILSGFNQFRSLDDLSLSFGAETYHFLFLTANFINRP